MRFTLSALVLAAAPLCIASAVVVRQTSTGPSNAPPTCYGYVEVFNSTADSQGFFDGSIGVVSAGDRAWIWTYNATQLGTVQDIVGNLGEPQNYIFSLQTGSAGLTLSNNSAEYKYLTIRPGAQSTGVGFAATPARRYETTVFVINPNTGAISARWNNPDGSAVDLEFGYNPGAQTIYGSGNISLTLGGSLVPVTLHWRNFFPV